MTRDAGELIALATELLRTNPYGFLVTDGTGGPHARLVQHLAVEDDLTIWVGTSPRSRKAQEIGSGGRAAFAVEDRSAFAYVSLTGPARVVADEDERAARWVAGLETFFPEGPQGDDFVLIALRPERVELMDFAAGVHPDPYGLVPAVLVRDGTGWRSAAAERDEPGSPS